MKKTITKTQISQFNRMRVALEDISHYDTPNQLKRSNIGLSYQEALEYAYENVVQTAKIAKRGIKLINR